MSILEYFLGDEPDIEYTGQEAAETFMAANDLELDDAYPQTVRLYEEDTEDQQYRYEIEYVDGVADVLPAPPPHSTTEGSITDPVLPASSKGTDPSQS